MHSAVNFPLLRFLKFTYYETYTYFTQIIYSDAHFNPLTGILNDKQLIIAEIQNF